MLRFVPPTGTPVRVNDILDAWKASVSGSGLGNEYLKILRTRLGVRHVLGAGSGRAALWHVLKTLHRLRPGRNIVALPAYTCFSVAASAVRAGLKLYPIEIDPVTLDFDFDCFGRVQKDKLLCIVSAHLFGFVNDLTRTKAIANEAGAFLIDNAAQAFGATRDGRLAGTGGDVGIYSFGRGKALSAIEGGAIVTDSDELASALRDEHLPENGSFLHETGLLFELFAYSALLRPRLYWIAEGLPFLKLGITEFDVKFPVRNLPRLSGELIARLLDQLERMNQIRRRNAASITNALRGSSSLFFPQPSADCQPAMVRLSVIARDAGTRTRAVSRLRRECFGASAFYPSAICDIPGIDSHMADSDFHRKNAERLSHTLFTLPVHPFVGERDIARMIDILSALPAKDKREEAGSQGSLSTGMVEPVLDAKKGHG